MTETPKAAIDLNLRSPRYAQVYAVLRDWILQGVYAPGQRMPSESELCDAFKVSRITVRSAVEMLEKEGLATRIQGRGTFVNTHLTDVPSRGDLSELVRRLRQLETKTSLKDIVITEENAHNQVAADLHLDKTDRVIHASFMRIKEGEAIGATDIYIPKSLGVEISAKDLKGPSPTLMESKGFDILGAHQLIGATLTDSQFASRLNIPVGSPMVTVRLLVLDRSNRPVELVVAHYRADRYMHHVFLAASSGQQVNTTPAKAR